MEKRGRLKMSKKELKMDLVSKRLSLLQHDITVAIHACSAGQVTVEEPTQHWRDSTGTKEKNADNLLKACGSCNSVRGIEEVSPSREIMCRLATIGREHASHKQQEVISHDEQEEDENKCVWIEHRKRKRTNSSKEKRVITNAALDPKNPKTSVKPKKRRIEKASMEKLSSAMKQAQDVQANLAAGYPSFIKLMMHSHVCQGFWLGISSKFCDAHLAKCDTIMVLVDEAGKEFKANYLVSKNGLSGGWRAFAIQHELQEGDAAVFQLITPTTFKVFIVRDNNLGEVDGALRLLTLDTCAEQQISEDHTHLPIDKQTSSPLDSLSPTNSNADVEPAVLDGIHLSDTKIELEAVKGFGKFNIIVNGLLMDSKFSDIVRKKYYDLCCCQKCLLHENLLKGLNSNLVVGIISETINIANAIRVCTSSTSVEDLRTWERTLKGFELLGMKVNFLCAKINQLLEIASELDMADESNKFRICKSEQDSTGQKVRALENKLADLQEMMEEIDLEMEAEMRASAQKHDAKLKEIMKFPR